MRVCACQYSACRGQERVLGSLQLNSIPVVVYLVWVLATNNESSKRAAGTFKCLAFFSPAKTYAFANQDNLSRFVCFLMFLFGIIKGLPHSGLPLQYVQLFFFFPLNVPEDLLMAFP